MDKVSSCRTRYSLKSSQINMRFKNLPSSQHNRLKGSVLLRRSVILSDSENMVGCSCSRFIAKEAP